MLPSLHATLTRRLMVVVAATVVLPGSSNLFAQREAPGDRRSTGIGLVARPFIATSRPQEESDSAGGADSQRSDQEETEQETVEDEGKTNAGQPDLDRAFELKIVAASTRDLDKIADLCESAIEKGLAEESLKQAKELWVSVLYEHARQLERRIERDGQLVTQWRWLRAQAISRLEKAIELRPEKVDALILLARLHSLRDGDREAALESIEKAIAQISDDKPKLSKALYIRALLAEDDASRIADLSQAVKIDPGNVDALLQRAMYLMGEEKTDEAMQDFQRLLKIEEEDTDRHVFISQALRRKGLFAEAVQILDLAVDIDPEDDDLLVLRSQAHLGAENEESALSDLDRALELNRQNLDALNLRARVHVTREDFEKALQDANELIQQRPESVNGLALRSLIYRAQLNLDKAIEDVESLVEMEPENLDFKFDLALLLNANEQPSRAIPIFDQVLRLSREGAHPQILRSRGDAYLSLGKHTRAIDDYELALDLMSEAEDASEGEASEQIKDLKSGILNNLSWVLSTSPEDDVRDGERAVKLATEAAELTEYKAAYILSTLASGYAETGDFETARKWARKAVELAEDDEQRVGLQEELDSYEKNEPWRERENVENKENDKEEDAADKKAEDTEDGKAEPSSPRSQPSDESPSEPESPEDPEDDGGAA